MGGSCYCSPPPFLSEFTSDPGSFLSVSRDSILGIFQKSLPLVRCQFHFLCLPCTFVQLELPSFRFAEFPILNQSSHWLLMSRHCVFLDMKQVGAWCLCKWVAYGFPDRCKSSAHPSWLISCFLLQLSKTRPCACLCHSFCEMIVVPVKIRITFSHPSFFPSLLASFSS